MQAVCDTRRSPRPRRVGLSSLARALLRLVGPVAVGGCAALGSARDFDVLAQLPPRAPHALRGVQLEESDYAAFVRAGESWFRNETFGGERATSDVAGLFDAEIEIPCPQGSAPPSCRVKSSALPFLIAALDELDGVSGNLFPQDTQSGWCGGNGGPLGAGYTSDLVIEFPPGTTLAGFEVPERLHTGLDVDAGCPWPIGIVPVLAAPEEAALPYLVEPRRLGVGPAPQGKYRLGIACALCHYSLDVDKDGAADVRSSRWDEDTPGSAFSPQHTWAVGNQDLHFGWLFSLTRNPLLGFTVLSGPVGENTPEAALRWVAWVKANYRQHPERVRREVVRGMLLQPRGLADDTPNALHDPNQLPVLFTYGNWPYNFDGTFPDPSDRNNGVWTGAIDFTGLIALARDRTGANLGLLFWEPDSVYRLLSAEEYADILVDQSPWVRYAPERRDELKNDILGMTDGIPGLLNPDNVVVMANQQGAVPKRVLKVAVEQQRVRTPADYGGDAEQRGSVMVLLGTRVTTTREVRLRFRVDQLVRDHPGLNADDFQSDAVSAFLDGLTPPPNTTALLGGASDLVPKGYAVFKDAGCAGCHNGPFLTDNRVHRLFDRRREEIGIAVPSTLGSRSLGRGTGPALGTAAYRSLANRPLQLYVAPDYDPETGRATAGQSLGQVLFGNRPVGYKTLTLRHLWASAPYLHDGGVGVALRPGCAAPGDDLRVLLGRPEPDKLYGTASILAERERHPDAAPWPNAALSLQALVLKGERAKVLAQNHAILLPTPSGGADNPLQAPAVTNLVARGVEGRGHEFWIDDEPGGDRVTALVAFLLALDDNPGDLP
jgi:hypothetical protein